MVWKYAKPAEAAIALHSLHCVWGAVGGDSWSACADVMRECMLQVKRAQTAAQQGTAPQPSSDMPLLVTHNSTSLKTISTCVKARMKVLKVLSHHQAHSAEARAAVMNYLELNMPGCRGVQGKDSSDKAQEVATAHLHLVHMVGA